MNALAIQLLSQVQLFRSNSLRVVELVIDLVSHLSGHTSRNSMVDEICDTIDDFCERSAAVIDQREDSTKASKNLDTVRNSDESVIAGIRLKVILLHDVDTRS